ncbi:hypothetical protein FQA39_LY07856 [Lamprigera yunnana]|nr:hypothetical protein FQA39_LY07856 [Lamprigera yunnana]
MKYLYAPDEDDLFMYHICYTEESNEDVNSEIENVENSEIDDRREIDSKKSVKTVKKINNMTVPKNQNAKERIETQYKKQNEPVEGNSINSKEHVENMFEQNKKNLMEMEVDELFSRRSQLFETADLQLHLLIQLISNMSSTLRGKHFHAQAREMAFNVYQWIKSQNEDQCTKEIKEKVSRATGVSVRTIKRIIKEGSTSPEAETDKRFKSLENKKQNSMCTVTALEIFAI